MSNGVMKSDIPKHWYRPSLIGLAAFSAFGYALGLALAVQNNILLAVAVFAAASATTFITTMMWILEPVLGTISVGQIA